MAALVVETQPRFRLKRVQAGLVSDWDFLCERRMRVRALQLLINQMVLKRVAGEFRIGAEVCFLNDASAVAADGFNADM